MLASPFGRPGFARRRPAVKLPPIAIDRAIAVRDAAVAAVVRASTPGEGSVVDHAHFETFSAGADLCICTGGGSWRPPNWLVELPEGLPDNARTTRSDNYFRMDSHGTLSFVGKYLRPVVERMRPGLGSSLLDIKWVVPHQASAHALEALRSLGWPVERTLRTIDKYGNCVAASVPLTLLDGIRSGRIKRGDRVLLCGLSAGFSFGGLFLTY